MGRFSTGQTFFKRLQLEEGSWSEVELSESVSIDSEEEEESDESDLLDFLFFLFFLFFLWDSLFLPEILVRAWSKASWAWLGELGSGVLTWGLLAAMKGTAEFTKLELGIWATKGEGCIELLLGTAKGDGLAAGIVVALVRLEGPEFKPEQWEKNYNM